MANAILWLPSRPRIALFVAFFAFTAGMILGTPSANAATVAKAPDAPTIVAPEWGEVVGESKPEFRGLVEHGMQVEIHVDREFHGLARVVDGGTTTDSFAGRPSLNLEPGLHTAVFRAKDPDTGLRSAKSEELSFWVRPQVAPALVETVVDSRTTTGRPFVVGFSTSDTNVKVYVDGVYDGMIGVGKHPSNAVHFAYQVEKPLKTGTHTITATAVSVDGRLSVMSKGLAYTVPSTAVVTTTKPTTTTPKPSGTSSENADSDDSSEPKVSGESDVVKDAEQKGDVSVTPDDEVTDDNTTVEVTTEDEDADRTDEKAEDETDNTALVTWIIVIIVLVIILALRLRSGAGAEPSDGSATGLAGGDGKSPEGTGKPTDNKNKNGKVPPPPPPSSSY